MRLSPYSLPADLPPPDGALLPQLAGVGGLARPVLAELVRLLAE